MLEFGRGHPASVADAEEVVPVSQSRSPQRRRGTSFPAASTPHADDQLVTESDHLSWRLAGLSRDGDQTDAQARGR
jgi:hypothetical protein